MSSDKLNVVYSTDTEEHKMNFNEEEEFNTLGMYQDENGVWQIKEELMCSAYIEE